MCALPLLLLLPAVCSEIYFTGGFNRWNHKRTLGPVKMRPPGPNGKHWQVRRKRAPVMG